MTLCLKRSGKDWECRAPEGHPPGMHVWGQTDEALLFHNGWSKEDPTLKVPVVMNRKQALAYLRSRS